MTLRTSLAALLFVATFASCAAFNVYVRSNGDFYDSSAIDRITLNADRSATLWLSGSSKIDIAPSEFTGLGFNAPVLVIDAEEDALPGLTIVNGYAQLPDGAAITVCDINGCVCATSESGRAYVGDLRPGVYVIRSNDKSIKILPR